MRMGWVILAAVLCSGTWVVNAADCYVSDCRTGDDGIPICYNEPIDCCELQSLQCDPHPFQFCADCVACEEVSGHIQCSAEDGESVGVLIREEPPRGASEEWGRGGLAGEGNDTGLWPRSGHYSAYSLD